MALHVVMPSSGKIVAHPHRAARLKEAKRPADPRESSFNNGFRDRLKEARQHMGWTQERMAAALGIGKEQYKTYEYRVAFPLYLLRDLATITDRSIAWLLTGRG
jgi:ribosome-binding protein aMBF1 (putative translation factor)